MELKFIAQLKSFGQREKDGSQGRGSGNRGEGVEYC
jgi:hypothetical protein